MTTTEQAHLESLLAAAANEPTRAPEFVSELLQSTVIVPGVVPRLSATPGRIDHLGPALGNANADVLGGLLGLHAEEIGRLRRQRVV